MAHLIDKDTLVTEIEKRIKEREEEEKKGWAYSRVKIVECEHILSFIDTLEVKEVDLDYIKNELDRVVKIYKPDGDFGWGTLYNIATHFFELGLKAQKGENNYYG